MVILGYNKSERIDTFMKRVIISKRRPTVPPTPKALGIEPPIVEIKIRFYPFSHAAADILGIHDYLDINGYYNLYLDGAAFFREGCVTPEIRARLSHFGIHNFRLVKWELGNSESLHEFAMEAIRSWDFSHDSDTYPYVPKGD